MDSILDRLVGRKSSSADLAKDRLKLVLINDRTDLTPDALNQLKDELIGVISKYIEIDSRAVNISIENLGREQRLIADIPLKANRRKR